MKNKKDSSWSNFYNYGKGKERLKHAILQHPDEDPGSSSVYNFIKSAKTKSKWVMPFDQYNKMGKSKK